MNIGFWMCFVMVPFFAVIALIFAIGKEKSAILISGFNSLPKREREKYGKARMARDMRNSFALWSLVMLIGAVASLLSGYAAIVAYLIWMILFFREVRFDPHMAFEKYLIKNETDNGEKDGY